MVKYKNKIELLEAMRTKLGHLMPEAELGVKAVLVEKINCLKEEKGAVILGHNYMEPAIYHFVADHRGDSLELCRKVVSAPEDIIIFCGVRFMAETAKIINPAKTVLIPSAKAGCSLAESITAEDVRRLRKEYPGVPIVTYVNTYADVKAESDYCCTSGNAAKVIASIKSDTVIYLPDVFMAQNLAKETGKNVFFPQDLQKESKTVSDLKDAVLAWHGKCEVHEQFRVEDVNNARTQHPGVVVLAHPECPPQVVAEVDFCGSTSAMITFIQDHPAPHYLLLTECSMGDNIMAASPGKEMLRLCSFRCPHMNEITLEQTLAALEKEQYEVDVPRDIRARAQRSIDRMLSIG